MSLFKQSSLTLIIFLEPSGFHSSRLNNSSTVLIAHLFLYCHIGRMVIHLLSYVSGPRKPGETLDHYKGNFLPSPAPMELCVWQYQFPTWQNTFTVVLLPCGVCPKAIKYLSIITPPLWSYCIKNKLKHFSILTVALISEAVALWLTSWQLIQRGYTQHGEGPSLGWGVTRHHEILQYSSEWYAI